MSDYVPCPACRGSGIVPLEVAADMAADIAAERDARVAAARERIAGQLAALRGPRTAASLRAEYARRRLSIYEVPDEDADRA